MRLKPIYFVLIFLIAGCFFVSLEINAQRDVDGVRVSRNRFEALRKHFGLDPYLGHDNLRNIKVAFLGYRYGGLEPGDPADPKGLFLPANVKLTNEYPNEQTRSADLETDATDRRLVEAISKMTGYHPETAPNHTPEIHLFNAHPEDPRNFKKAVEAAREWGAHVIVNTINYPKYGNMDGTGPFSAFVEDSFRAGMIWLQASGNFRKHVANGRVILENIPGNQNSRWSRVRNGREWYLRIKVNADNVRTKFTLSWNAYSTGSAPSDFHGTTKDLNLALYEPNAQGTAAGVLRASSEWRQTLNTTPNVRERTTPFAFETMTVRLFKRAHPYLLAIKHGGGEFSRVDDRFRVTLEPESFSFYDAEERKNVDTIEFLDATDDGSIMVPADIDDRYGLVIGDIGKWSSIGPVPAAFNSRPRPYKADLRMDAPSAYFPDTSELGGPEGPALALAYFAAFTALMKAREPNLDIAALRRLIQRNTPNPDPYDPIDSDSEKRRLEADNWIFDVSRMTQNWAPNGNPHPAVNKLAETIGEEVIAFKRANAGRIAVAVKKHPLELSYFQNVPPAVRNNFQSYRYYLRATRSGNNWTLTAVPHAFGENRTPWATANAREEDYVQLVYVHMPVEIPTRYSRSQRFLMPDFTILTNMVNGR